MRRYRKNQYVTILILAVAIAGLSIGFAVFSDTLTISSSAIVKPDSTSFNVQFSANSDGSASNTVSGVAANGAVAGTASITNDGDTPTISNITATFTEPGQSVTYTFYSHNSGAYVAHLNNVTFNNVTGENSSKVCTAVDATNTSSTLMNSACADINVTVKVGNVTATNTLNNITGHSLDKGAYEEVVVTVSYSSNNNVSDGDFRVEFGDILLEYSSAGV